MARKDDKWDFVNKSGRPALTPIAARNLRAELAKTIKVGIECEYNLPDQKSSCKGSNNTCKCINVHKEKDGRDCFAVCNRHGSCDMEKDGCPDPEIYCLDFESACATCTKFDKGCAKCPKKHVPENSPAHLRKNVTEALHPTKFLGKLGEFGVLDVVVDGSLLGEGGVEIVTVGRRAGFKALYDTCKKVMDVSRANKAFVDERTSIHFHILSGYLSNGKYNDHRPNYGLPGRMQFDNGGVAQEDGTIEVRDLDAPIPEIVLANFHQLWRRVENAFVWMSTTGTTREALTRWAKFRKSLLKYSAVRAPMNRVIEEIRGSNENARYMAVNYCPTKFDANGNISRFHFEIRVPDGSFSPAATAALACLACGLVLKAVDISKYGIVESGDKEYMERAKNISAYLMNGDGAFGGARLSDTTNLDPYIPELVHQSKEMIKLVKSYLITEQPAYDILERLAEKPISLRRIEGKDWDTIEQELLPGANEEDSISKELVRIIDLNVFSECATAEEWIDSVAADQGIDKSKVADRLLRMSTSGQVFWNDTLGAVVRR